MVRPAAPPLVAFLAATGHRSVFHTENRGWNCFRAESSAGCHPSQRPRPVGGGLFMEDFSSSTYWDKVYTSGEDGSALGQEAVSEWHVGGEVMVEAVDRLLGGASGARDDGGEELTILNVGCGTSTLWERWVSLGIFQNLHIAASWPGGDFHVRYPRIHNCCARTYLLPKQQQ